jgi:hypothetical protein
MNGYRITKALATMDRNELVAEAFRKRLFGQGTGSTAASAAERIGAAETRLYDAECALHAAHQSEVDAWIDAANSKLQAAANEYVLAIGAARAVRPVLQQDAPREGTNQLLSSTPRRAAI